MTPEKIRKYRKLGFLILAISWFILVIPMFIGAFGGYNTKKVWDPYTGNALSADDIATCGRDANVILSEAESMVKVERRWNLKAQTWMVKCRKKHPDLYDKITRRRAQLRHPNE